MKAYSLDLRQKVVDALTTSGQTQKQIADRFGVHLATVQRYARLHREQQPLLAKTAPGRPMKITPEHEPVLRRLVEENPSGTLDTWRDAWQKETGQTVCRAALHLHLHRRGYRLKKVPRGR